MNSGALSLIERRSLVCPARRNCTAEYCANRTEDATGQPYPGAHTAVPPVI